MEAPGPEGGTAETFWLGFDIGGTRLKSGIVKRDGSVERPQTLDSALLDFPAVHQAIRAAVRDSLAASAGGSLQGIGVAMPGIVEAGFGSRYLPGKVAGIEGFPIRQSLEDEFGVAVRCINDGAAATLAEWRFGAARGIDDVVGLTLGTGVGSGVVVNGRPFETSNLGSGLSVGHFTIHTGGRLCLCGNRGCAETLVSAAAVAGRLREALTRRVPSVLAEQFARDPASITFQSLVEGVEGGDRLCLDLLEEFTRDLGATIVTAIHAYNPSVVVLAGGPMAASSHFLPQVQAYVDRYSFIFPKARRVEIRPARLGNHAGVLGAVALVMSELEDGSW